MKKNSTGGFMLVSILMQVLHSLRGRELSFIVDGPLPYVLYYGTMALFVACLLYHVVSIVRNLYINGKEELEK